MSDSSDPSLRRIFTAALSLFSRNGFQRTSMAEIAREGDITPATLHLRFSEKAGLFEALATSLVDEALARAESARDPDAPLSENTTATLLAKDRGFFQRINATPFGAEVLELHAERTGAHVARLDAGFAALLAEGGREAVQEGADLTVFGDADGFGAFLATAGSGLNHETPTEEAFRSAVNCLAHVSALAAGRHNDRTCFQSD